MPVTRSSQSFLMRHAVALAAVILASALAAPGFAQYPPYMVVTPPNGLISLVLEDPVLYAPTAGNYWYRPAGRFAINTGPAVPAGGNPTITGDENVRFSGWYSIDANNALGSTNRETFAVDANTYDIHALMNATATNTIANLVENYWPSPFVATTRGAVGTARIPIDNATPSLAKEFIIVEHRYTVIGDMLKCEYFVTNNTLTPRSVGMRIVVDPYPLAGISNNEPITLSDNTVLTHEAVIPDPTNPASAMPVFWDRPDYPDNPVVICKGLIKPPDILDAAGADEAGGIPDQLQFGWYYDMDVVGQYNFTPNTFTSIIGANNPSIGVKWNQKPLAVGATRRYVTYNGLGDAAADYTAPSTLQCYAPYSLKATPGPDPYSTGTPAAYHLTDQSGNTVFPISVYVDNFGSAPVVAATAQITLPTGLQFEPAGQPLARSMGTIPVNGFVGTSWTVRATTARPGPAVIKIVGPRGTVVNFTINIPAIPVLNPLVSPRGIEMVSIPYTFIDNDAETVFASLGLLGAGANGNVIVWLPSLGTYHWFPDTGTTNIVPGEGFWLLNQNRSVIQLPSSATPVTDNPAVVSVQKGWNQVGNPFTASVMFSSMQVEESNSATWTMQQAISRGLIMGTLFAYDPPSNGYTWEQQLPNVRMDPYMGYWLYAYEDLTLVIPQPAVFTPEAAKVAASTTTTTPVGANNWQVPIAVSAAGLVRNNRAFAVKAAAVSGLHDVLSPPVMTYGTMLTADFYKDANATGTPYVVDCRTSAAGVQTWYLAVSTNAANQNVTVTWPDLSQLPANLIATLQDPATGQSRYMRTTTGYTYNSGSTPGQRVLSIVVQPKQGNGSAVTNVMVAQVNGAMVQFTYTLSAAANMDVVVLNISGIPVKHLAAGALAQAGNNTAAWNGLNDRGAPVPSGRYIVQMTAHAPDTGMQSSVVRTFQLNR